MLLGGPKIVEWTNLVALSLVLNVTNHPNEPKSAQKLMTWPTLATLKLTLNVS
jgi:hypothetical protein